MKGISNKTKVKLNKKSKISKKQTKRKNKKSLKSFKIIQKGGIVTNKDVFMKISKKTMATIIFDTSFPNCFLLITEFSQSPEQLQPRVKIDGTRLEPVDFWSYESKIKATPDFERIFEDPLDWYQHKNPNYEPLNNIEIRVPEFKFIIAKIIKDLLVSLYLDRMPQLLETNGKKYPIDDVGVHKLLEIQMLKIYEILRKIEQNIIYGYLYIQFIEYLCSYTYLYNFFDQEKCTRNLLLLEKTLRTPFIILPTLVQINFKKVINLIRAPLLNFRLSNNQQYVHNMYRTNCFEIFHDIFFHSKLTHDIDFRDLFGFMKNENENLIKPKLIELHKNVKSNYIIINNYFNRMYHLCEEEPANYMLLFLMFHEINGIRKLILNNNLTYNTVTYNTLIEDLTKLESVDSNFLRTQIRNITKEQFMQYIKIFIQGLEKINQPSIP